MKETEYYEIGYRYHIPEERYVSIGYKNKKTDEIFYLTNNYCFSNNIDDALYITNKESDNILRKLKEMVEEKNIETLDSIYKLLWIVGDSYRIIRYLGEANVFSQIFGVYNTLNLAKMRIHLEEQHKDINNIELVIEKYFIETDEWYNIETGMTREEELISEDLVSVVNRFNKLSSHHPTHQPDMCNAIHDIQRIIQSRICHRLYPEQYPIKK